MADSKYNNKDDKERIEQQISEYNQRDTYLKPGAKQANVGKLDEYNKEKELYEKQKAKVVLDPSKDHSKYKEKNIDDFVPENIGSAIDNVFSKVDSLLDATGKLFFGTKKAPARKAPAKKPVSQPRPNPAAQTRQRPALPPAAQSQTQQKTQTAQAQQRVQAAPPVQQKPQSIQAPAAKTPAASKPVRSIEEDDDGMDRSPPVTRSTPISDLDLPLDILSDPDIVRYFDQMKLYDKKVPGGFGSLTFNQAARKLKKGRWGKLFTIKYEQLKINSMMSSAEAGQSRFNGMMPVYKALGRNFTNSEELKKAIEEDINLYLKTGDGSDKFHKFTYKVNRKR